ncbi:hypothetical protein SCWH03_29140 [Streptomyces pacificus]|uniref:Uncharacterized protein n=1 Tax=Streptomyces pacificus TaxID=2705029 RepID=A0A6A0AUT0_9ACTN|nr:hypothetical protein SCWH03_29140 [Streptomyces pacificus]
MDALFVAGFPVGPHRQSVGCLRGRHRSSRRPVRYTPHGYMVPIPGGSVRAPCRSLPSMGDTEEAPASRVRLMPPGISPAQTQYPEDPTCDFV